MGGERGRKTHGKAPTPCINCWRYHYGVCNLEPHVCNNCGALNHIERYCPQRRRITVENGEPLPGTVSWCRMWRLQGDIREKVLNALKRSPGSAIWVDGYCIYTGDESHLFTRGTNAEASQRNDMDRQRSRSPERGIRMNKEGQYYERSRSPAWRRRARSRTPLRRRSPPPQREWRRPRSRTPLRQRSTSPFRHELEIPRRRRSPDNRSWARVPSPARQQSPMVHRLRDRVAIPQCSPDNDSMEFSCEVERTIERPPIKFQFRSAPAVPQFGRPLFASGMNITPAEMVRKPTTAKVAQTASAGSLQTPYAHPSNQQPATSVSSCTLFSYENRPSPQEHFVPATRALGDFTNKGPSTIRAAMERHSPSKMGTYEVERRITEIPKAKESSGLMVKDPHFILGIAVDASEDEICEAYTTRVWEVELERLNEGPAYIPAVGEEDVYDESVDILNAARKKLIGY